jgi:glycosyltransferase involved in cell wall biosynthesis
VLEFAQHGRNAWLVEPDSAPAIAAALRRLLSDSALRHRLAEGALATARARQWGEVYDQLLDDYGAAVAARAGSRVA